MTDSLQDALEGPSIQLLIVYYEYVGLYQDDSPLSGGGAGPSI